MSVVIIPAYKPDETLVTIIVPAKGIINTAAMVFTPYAAVCNFYREAME